MSKMIVRLPGVKARTGLSRSTIYLWVSQGRFPKPVSLGARSVGWISSDLDTWLDGLSVSRSTTSLSSPSAASVQGGTTRG